MYVEYRQHIIEQQREQRQLQQASSNNTKAAVAEKPKSALTQEERKELNRLVKQIAKLEKQEKELKTSFTDPSHTPEDYARLGKELSVVKSEREEKEMRWMELEEKG